MVNLDKKEIAKIDTSRFGENIKNLDNVSYNVVLVEFSSPSLSPETDFSKSLYKNKNS
jgi:hypothetical protein